MHLFVCSSEVALVNINIKEQTEQIRKQTDDFLKQIKEPKNLTPPPSLTPIPELPV